MKGHVIDESHVTVALAVYMYLDSTEQLVEEVGHPVVVQLDPNDTAQVSIHQIHHNVAMGACEGEGERV